MYYPTDPIKNLLGVGEYAEKKFKAQGINTIGDLLNYFPFRYEDLSIISKIKDIKIGENVVLKGQFKQIVPIKSKTGRQMITGKFFDETGILNVLWFNSTFILRTIKEGELYTVSGKPSFYLGKPNIVNPQFELSNDASTNYGRIVPIYFNILGVAMKTLRRMMKEAVEKTKIEDFLEENLLSVNREPFSVKTKTELTGNGQRVTGNYLNLKEAYQNLHFPESFEKTEQAKDRIALNELIHVKLHSEKTKQILQKYKSKIILKKTYNKIFQATLPFTLTKDQKNAITKISKLLKLQYPANALLSGDVGSGKTIVAINTSLNVLKNGGKVLYLAPTLVLAEQVFQEFNRYLLTGNGSRFTDNNPVLKLITSKTKKLSSEELEETNILIGTHALLNIPEIEKFAHLVIIDEQHKFGVAQRAKLIEGENPPHILTMTATPIPRSLALAYFDELTLIQIKHKPAERLPITTKLLSESKRNDCFSWIKKEVIETQKILCIVPFIEKSKAIDFENVKSIEQVETELIKYFGKNYVTTLHGKLKNEEKSKIMEDFKKQTGGILLSTQVIEVGVDIKEATVIIIESAERFGLASLHQLRGRVGRNNLKSYCFLFTSNNSKNERLQTLEKEQDGFKLASFDLKNRGGGEIFGIRQSGEIDLKFVDFSKVDILNSASNIAKSIYNDENLFKSYKNNFFTREIFDIKDN
ncbi:ATP-dependent DNA helicase RecG [Patescibacteria group bacterium]|nr:ATP-dependent DNA helicase RecG [Patescibacteria group bacterium]